MRHIKSNLEQRNQKETNHILQGEGCAELKHGNRTEKF